ncbi:unnamed protein product [Acanthoscelides obtectus]|uniref:Uncharacterized protein n=1 Tax=Acanthoscelides obtectus TaxID=200917 RepID=A0A9P0JWS9_ACAOB|nr:unnamed protein product [Acanthoscelides obtectus]CAK1648874.1 hypothetical protein AOBTE_LOCUS15941 [Acanthoscelides obtectus]
MPTKNQAEFERSLVEALRSNNIANAISEAIITNITRKLAEKFHYYVTKIASLEAEIQLLKTGGSQWKYHNKGERVSCREIEGRCRRE